MGFWFLILLSLLSVGKSQHTTASNQTDDLHVAIADMRKMSYHGFVILLKILNSTSNAIPGWEITFLMPNDEELSKVPLRQDHLQEFILEHSIPTALLLSHLLHFPNGTLVPSNVPNKMLTITNTGRSGLFVNNARIVTPNVCMNSLIRCHGISSTITFGNVDPSRQDLKLLGPDLVDSANTHQRRKAKFSPVHVKKAPALH